MELTYRRLGFGGDLLLDFAGEVSWALGWGGLVCRCFAFPC